MQNFFCLCSDFIYYVHINFLLLANNEKLTILVMLANPCSTPCNQLMSISLLLIKYLSVFPNFVEESIKACTFPGFCFNGYDNYVVFFYRETSCGVFETNGKKTSHAGITFWSPCDVSRPIIIEAIYGVKSVPADEK